VIRTVIIVINHSLPGRANILPEDPAEEQEIVLMDPITGILTSLRTNGYFHESGRKEMTAMSGVTIISSYAANSGANLTTMG
jgi:hypothetical protein